MNKTKIEWCESTWNPVTGCLHGCEYCYAQKEANRFKGCIDDESKYFCRLNATETGSVIELMSPMEKLTKKGDIITAPYPFGFSPTFHRYLLNKPREWRKPRTIFVGSMADLFGDWVPDEWIEQVFNACKKAPKHRYLFLTKNPKRYCDLIEQGEGMYGNLPAANNMWFGTTITSVTDLIFWGDGWNTFISIEPLLTDLKEVKTAFSKMSIKWVIIGAETGNRKDKVVPEKEWIDNICRAADNAGLPVFMKDSLIPIVGEVNMRREFPWKNNTSRGE